MKKTILAVLLAILVIAVPRVQAQGDEKSEAAGKGKKGDAAMSKAAVTSDSITALRVQVVFSEYEGDKKIASLPYTLLVNADDKGPQAAVRMGLKVPIEVSGNPGNMQLQYQDIGTNLDGRADKADDGRFLLRLNVEKSSVYTPNESQKSASGPGYELSTKHPIVQQFRTQVNLLIRDGQTIQSTVATDPVSGHVTKVDVTLNVVK